MRQQTPTIQYSTVADSVYVWIKNAIIQGDFKPGEHIAQERLTKELGVSRTPVRDAFKRLETEGLLVAKPHCGAEVFQPSKELLTEVYDVRILLEQYCAARSCMLASNADIRKVVEASMIMLDNSYTSKAFIQGDRIFHSALCSISKCTNSIEILQGLWTKCESFKSLYFSLTGKANITLTEHAQIVQCLQERNVEGIKLAIAEHLNDVKNSIQESINFQAKK